ncbi:glycosyltransferase, partial [Saprospiraceae bacterium]|nr:glycosyltransferase [Saprospiraceae bacterium]
MRILCFIDSLGSGGAQRQLTQLGVGFKMSGHEVEFLVYHKEDFYRETLIENDIPINEIICNGYFGRVLSIRSFIRKGKYDLVLSFLEGVSLIATVVGFPKRRWKLIVGERNANPKILNSVKLRFYRWMHLFVDKIVSNSHSNIEMIHKINPYVKNKSSVINNIVDFSKFNVLENFKYRQNGRTRILVAATQVYRKNALGLVIALAAMSPKKRSKLDIVWFGERIEEPYFDKSFSEVEAMISKHNLQDSIRFEDSTPKIHEYMMTVDAVALFSFYEGQPNTIIEGMSCGKPVICSNVSDIPTLLNH